MKPYALDLGVRAYYLFFEGGAVDALLAPLLLLVTIGFLFLLTLTTFRVLLSNDSEHRSKRTASTRIALLWLAAGLSLGLPATWLHLGVGDIWSTRDVIWFVLMAALFPVLRRAGRLTTTTATGGQKQGESEGHQSE